jgi:hypothetical protein
MARAKRGRRRHVAARNAHDARNVAAARADPPPPTFRDDLRTSLRALRHTPRLVLWTTMLLAALYATMAVRFPSHPSNPPAAPPQADARAIALVIAYLILGLVFSGFTGTQRVWYLHTLCGERLASWQVRRYTRAFIGRFLRLELLISLAVAPAPVSSSAPGRVACSISSSLRWRSRCSLR